MKTYLLDEIGELKVIKSAKAKKIIIKINYNGEPQVTIPRYLPYIIGLQFAQKQRSWILKNRTSKILVLSNGDIIANKYTVRFTEHKKPHVSSRVQGNYVNINIPAGTDPDNALSQNEAIKASTRAMKRIAEDTLPTRLYNLAIKHGYSYNSIAVKNMKTRWGSCSSQGAICLNIWLIQLRDELIDYVCCHELAHLRNPHHQQGFWDDLSVMVPNYRELRKELKSHSPRLNPQQPQALLS
ncbi:MAG: family peptidase [Patescibacteria group bacterium]|jgi:predicted metal-dependent hydrolase|nr:family peptidase [Patescibacteria group bacterium]